MKSLATKHRLTEFRCWSVKTLPLLLPASAMVVCLTAANLVAQGSGDSSGSSSSSSSGSEYGSSSSDGYGNESGAPPKPEANLTTGPTPMSLFQLIQPDWKPLRQQIARVLAPSTTPAAAPMVGPLLRNEANVAFRYGNLPLARELYFGFLAHGTDEATEDLEKLKFSSYFRRPVWQLHWAVSVGLHGDTDVTDFAPIQAGGAANGINGMDSSMEMSSSYDSSSDPQMSGSSSGPGSPSSSTGSPSSSTGSSSSGTGMAGVNNSSRGAGMSGPSPDTSSSDVGYESGGMDLGSGSDSGGYPQFDINGRPIDPNASATAAPKAQMTDPAISARFEELMGYVATTVAEGMRTRMASGQFGEAFAGIDPEAIDQGDMVDGDYVEPSEPRMWIPSVVYLGEGSSQEMSKAAANQGIELLLHFDVSMKNVRNSTPQNSTRVKVIDGRSGRTLITSSEMDNREVQRLLQNKRGTAEGYVKDALEKFWSILDSKLSLQPFPTLPPASARGRVTGVLGDPAFSLLRKLAEIQYMGKKKWLTEDEVEQAYSIAAGSDGMRILYGSESEAISTIHEIAERSAKQTVSQTP